MNDSLTFIANICILLVPLGFFSYLIGRLIFHSAIEAIGIGFILLVACSNMTYEIFSHYHIATTYFWLSAMGSALLSAYIIKRFIPWEDKQYDSSHSPRALISLAITSCVIILKRTIYDVPRAQTQFFQSWYPDYVDISFASGYFVNFAQNSQLGEGFITSAQSYAVNTLGLIMLLEQVYSVGDSFVTYTATTMCAALIGLWTLAWSFRKQPILVYIFSAFVILYFLADYHTHWVLGTNWSDEIMILGGALLIYYLATPDIPYNNRIYGAILVSSTLVFGRNYGAFYGAVIAGALGAFLLYRDKASALIPLIVMGGFFAVFSMPELLKIYRAENLFYPRISLLEIAPFEWKKLFVGTSLDWFISSKATVLHTSLVYILCLFFLFKNKPSYTIKNTDYFALFVPFIVLLLPLVLELITSYRKFHGYSKLYHFAAWFPIWYPLHVLRYLHSSRLSIGETKKTNTRWHGYPKKLLVLYILSAIVLVGGNKNRMITFVNDRFIEGPSAPAEQQMAEALKQAYNDKTLKQIIERPILYTHAEPGIGFRRFMGGSLLLDYDLYSDCIQSRITPETSLKSFLEKTNAPIIYISSKLPLRYYNYTKYTDTGLFNHDADYYSNLPYLKIIKAGKQFMLIPDTSMLNINEPLRRICNTAG